MNDQDGGVTDAKWQWSRSMDMDTDDEDWVTIPGATSQTRSPEAADEGHYLRASVTYTDSFGSGKMVSAVTGNPGGGRGPWRTPRRRSSAQDDDNNGVTPVDGIQINRSVDENTDCWLQHRQAGVGFGQGQRRTGLQADPRHRCGQVRHRRRHGPDQGEGQAGLGRRRPLRC